jgi:hypothetical protein
VLIGAIDFSDVKKLEFISSVKINIFLATPAGDF